jgi:hypothetical protein
MAISLDSYHISSFYKLHANEDLLRSRHSLPDEKQVAGLFCDCHIQNDILLTVTARSTAIISTLFRSHEQVVSKRRMPVF